MSAGCRFLVILILADALAGALWLCLGTLGDALDALWAYLTDPKVLSRPHRTSLGTLLRTRLGVCGEVWVSQGLRLKCFWVISGMIASSGSAQAALGIVFTSIWIGPQSLWGLNPLSSQLPLLPPLSPATAASAAAVAAFAAAAAAAAAGGAISDPTDPGGEQGLNGVLTLRTPGVRMVKIHSF